MKRPLCDLTNVGFNVNKMIKIAHQTLIEEGMEQAAENFMGEIEEAKTLGNVFGIINKYVDTNSDIYDYLAKCRRGSCIELNRSNPPFGAGCASLIGPVSRAKPFLRPGGPGGHSPRFCRNLSAPHHIYGG